MNHCRSKPLLNVEEALRQAMSDRFSLAIVAVNEVIERALTGEKYPRGETWRSRPVAEHVAHASAHLDLRTRGDLSEPHLEHAATRLLMALENELRERMR